MQQVLYATSELIWKYGSKAVEMSLDEKGIRFESGTAAITVFDTTGVHFAIGAACPSAGASRRRAFRS